MAIGHINPPALFTGNAAKSSEQVEATPRRAGGEAGRRSPARPITVEGQGCPPAFAIPTTQPHAAT